MIELTRRYRFPAAHVLSHPSLSREENERIFGKCANPAGHGHNYAVEVTLAGPVDPRTGQVFPVEDLDAIFDRTIRSRFSHRMLNELPIFAERVPTGENIARAIHDDLARALDPGGPSRLKRVRVVETSRNSSEYGE
ncbi:MAG: 6-carboxytetrahydropterin synthase [Myxococcota bacterium]